jgi:hypothetical protein
MAKKKRLTLVVLLSLAVMALGIFPSAGCTNDSSQQAVLSMKEGNVFVMAEGGGNGGDNWTVAQVSQVLKAGDTIRVDQGSRAEVTFFEGSVIELEEGTIISISELSHNADTGSTTIALNEEVGRTISRVTKLSDQNSSYEVETPACVAAVKGSVMEVYVDPEGTTQVINQEGTIVAISQGLVVQIPEGMQSTVIPGQPPSSPFSVGGEGAGSIQITKSVLSEEGGVVTYQYEVTNVGDVPQSNVYITDDEVDVITYLSGDTNGNNILDPGETWIYTGS